jgi:hypothetical protein
MVVVGLKAHALTHRRYSSANDSLSLRYLMKAGGIAHANQRCKIFLAPTHFFMLGHRMKPTLSDIGPRSSIAAPAADLGVGMGRPLHAVGKMGRLPLGADHSRGQRGIPDA